MSERYEKVVFRRVDPLILRYGMEYYPGCFTPSGMRPHHTEQMRQWCQENLCGYFTQEFDLIKFESEEDLMHFLMRWA